MKLAHTLAAAAVIVGAASSFVPRTADAFCGFYVSPGDQKLFNDATQVVLMRSGTRTVLSMQNAYQGPPSEFAMVVPVPVVLKESDVKTLEPGVFARVEQMGAPRLVEYWEQDPCRPERREELDRKQSAFAGGPMPPAPVAAAGLGVTIEAQFTVGEYNIVILSAKDSTGLDTWLRQENYKIPEGAEPLLRPYVESGMKFFVAKVDPTKVKFEGDRAALSPLRFHYDSEEFALPIRLGLANSAGTQDLIVSILAPSQRYEVANYKNVTIPTNLEVTAQMKDRFAQFYTALFDRTLEKNPGAVVTEYAWDASSCDPCPGPTLGSQDFTTLGADVLEGTSSRGGMGFVLTRLHARYGKDITNDLTFKAAPPIVGGRESRDASGQLEARSMPSSMNNFQGRYAIRHPWTGPITCEKPVRGRWGGPPGGGQPATKPALGLATAARGDVVLASAVMSDIPELGITGGGGGAGGDSASAVAVRDFGGSGAVPGSAAPPARPSALPTRSDARSGCGCGTTDRNGGMVAALMVGVVAFVRRRRRA